MSSFFAEEVVVSLGIEINSLLTLEERTQVWTKYVFFSPYIQLLYKEWEFITAETMIEVSPSSNTRNLTSVGTNNYPDNYRSYHRVI
jgi:hypothetical protein